MNCVICYESTDLVSCSYRPCNTKICKPCLYDYLQLCIRESRLPNCTDADKSHCLGQYDEKSFSEQPITVIEEYRKLLIDRYEKIDKPLDKSVIITNIIKARKEFIETAIPKGIYHCMMTLFNKEVNNTSDIVQNYQSDITDLMAGMDLNARATNKCPVPSCIGYMANQVCQTCHAKKCVDCNEVYISDHVCEQAAVLAFKELKASSTQCPTCFTYIQRSYGCDAMTCAVCDTDFWINIGGIGKVSEFGNHKVNKSVGYKHGDSFTKLLIRNDKLQRITKIFEDSIALYPAFTIATPELNTLMERIVKATDKTKHGLVEQFSQMYSENLREQLDLEINRTRLRDIFIMLSTEKKTEEDVLLWLKRTQN